MALCEFCENINLADLVVDDAVPMPLGWQEPPGLAHQPSWEALQESAHTCALCSLIAHVGSEKGFDPTSKPLPQLTFDPRQISRTLKIQAMQPMFRPNRLELDVIVISSAQGLNMQLDVLADKGLCMRFH